MTKKTTTVKNSAEIAAINFETSNFSFKIKNEYLHICYDCTSIKTGFTKRKIKSYGVLDEEQAKFGLEQLEELYEDSPASSTVRGFLKEMIASNTITSPLGKDK